jgi:hypothetical protein
MDVYGSVKPVALNPVRATLFCSGTTQPGRLVTDVQGRVSEAREPVVAYVVDAMAEVRYGVRALVVR